MYKVIIRPEMQKWYATFPFGTRLDIGLDGNLLMNERYVIVHSRTREAASEAVRIRFKNDSFQLHSEGQFTEARRAFYPDGPCAVIHEFQTA